MGFASFGEAVGSALAAGLAVAVLSLIVELARRRAKKRGDATYLSPITGKTLRVDGRPADEVLTKRCRYCSEEADLEAVDCPYCKRSRAYE